MLSAHKSLAAALLFLAACATVPGGTPERKTLLWSHGQPAYEVVAPRGYRIDEQNGMDFSLYYLVRGHDPHDRGAGIYVANFPSVSRTRRDAQHVRGTIAGRATEWTCSPNACEAIVPDLVPQSQALLVWVAGRDAAEVAQFRRIAEQSIVQVR